MERGYVFYKPTSTIPQISKLFGCSQGLHHHNSFRYGFRYKENVVEIYAYMYVNKERISKMITTVPYGVEIGFSLFVGKNLYYSVVKVKDRFIFNYYKKGVKHNIGYQLNGYFADKGENSNVYAKIKRVF